MSFDLNQLWESITLVVVLAPSTTRQESYCDQTIPFKKFESEFLSTKAFYGFLAKKGKHLWKKIMCSHLQIRSLLIMQSKKFFASSSPAKDNRHTQEARTWGTPLTPGTQPNASHQHWSYVDADWWHEAWGEASSCKSMWRRTKASTFPRWADPENVSAK